MHTSNSVQALLTFVAAGRWLALFALFSALLSNVVLRADEPTAPPESEITPDDREHWSFRPLVRPQIPAVRDGAWCRTPVDRFILARLESAGLTPLPQAERETLLRRLTFDLTGLPPTPAEVAAFVHDTSPDAVDRLIDRLLTSPYYGERWAQHWLDLVRFAETDGFEHDLERPNAWRYRDWVIEALNADLPYDEFVRLQLAGDELRPDSASAAIATGFLLCGPDMPDINLQEERRHNFMNDMTATVGSALLGLQLGCAQCHDHKYDPISQYDFYRLRAIFDPVAIFKDHPLPRPPGIPAPPESPEQVRLRQLTTEIQTLEDAARQKLKAANPDLQPNRDDLVKALSEEQRARHELLAGELAKLQKTFKPPEIPLGRTVEERLSDLKSSRLMIRGDFRRAGPEIVPAFVRVANPRQIPIAAPAAGTASSGRRTQFAEWITQPDHPLATRVIVNRIWQHHFGRGLVESSSDFGKMGADPTLPELLDWLATELPRQGWSLKQLHRLILQSAVYRQASQPACAEWSNAQQSAAQESWAKSRRIDPENRWLARMNRHRLEGEAIRDSMLASSGRLNSRRGGPGVRPPLPAEITSTLLANQWKVSPDEADHRRRSIYLFVRRNLRYPLFEAFDRPDSNASCPRRNRSTIAPQALILLNSEFSLAAARDLAGSLLAEDGDDSGRLVAQAYARTLGRPPTADETAIVLQFLESQAQQLKSEGRAETELAIPSPLPAGTDAYRAAALTDFCLALFNLNEFVYVD